MEIKLGKSVKVLVILASIVLLMYLSHYIQGMYRVAQAVEVRSSLENIWGFLAEHRDTEDIKDIIAGLNKNWKVLTRSEHEKLAKALSRKYYGKDESAKVSNSILVDRWNQQILIVGRKLSCEPPEFVVWSKGPDGICSTIDDIVFPCPWDVLSPEQLKE